MPDHESSRPSEVIRPNLDQFVGETVSRFLAQRTKPNTDGEPYMLEDAARDVIRASGHSPIALVTPFIEQTSVYPGHVGDLMEPGEDHWEGTWEEVCLRLTSVILMWQANTRPEIDAQMAWRSHAYEIYRVVHNPWVGNRERELRRLKDEEAEIRERFGPDKSPQG